MEFRILDKDLDKLANRESAGAYSLRPVQRLGVALIFAALAMVAGAALTGAEGGWMLAAGAMVGAFLALSIGANDSSNAMGPAVGAGAISMRNGLLLVALAEVLGALTAGDRVTNTLSSGILPPDLMDSPAGATAMLAAMIAAAAWIMLATWVGAPISTTHAIVGGIAGAGIAVFGTEAPDWVAVLRIAFGWLVSPLLAAVIAAALLAVLRKYIHRAPDRVAAAQRWLPLLVAAVVAVLSAYALTLARAPGLAILIAVPLISLGGWWLAHQRMEEERVAPRRPREMMERMFGPPLVAAAVLIGFGHGANDVGNVVAPLSVIAGQGGPDAPLSPLWLGTGGLGFALGAALFGRRLVRMVGSRITRLNPARGLCVAIATALVLLAATWLGLPISTTHVAVGGVLGVGFYREWEEQRSHKLTARAPLPPEETHRRRVVRRMAVLRTLAAWAVTVPITGLTAAAIAWTMT